MRCYFTERDRGGPTRLECYRRILTQPTNPPPGRARLDLTAYLSMPVMDGLSATARIVHRSPGTPVVLITIQDEPGIKSRGLAAGALGYVVKFTADLDLLPAVRAALRGERFVGSRFPK